MEYFIVEEGEMFNTVLTILKQKVKEGCGSTIYV